MDSVETVALPPGFPPFPPTPVPPDGSPVSSSPQTDWDRWVLSEMFSYVVSQCVYLKGGQGGQPAAMTVSPEAQAHFVRKYASSVHKRLKQLYADTNHNEADFKRKLGTDLTNLARVGKAHARIAVALALLPIRDELQSTPVIGVREMMLAGHILERECDSFVRLAILEQTNQAAFEAYQQAGELAIQWVYCQ